MTAMTRYNPWSFLRDIQGEVNQLFDKSFPGSDVSQVETSQWTPHVDTKEEANKFVILADVPGVDPKDIKISMKNNTLTLRGERKIEREAKEENYTRIERFSGNFYRRFTLPDQVDPQGIKAKSRHGVLEITIPKKETYIPKEIDVQVES